VLLYLDLSLVLHHFSTLWSMDGLSAAASVTAIIDISVKVISFCFQYSVAVKDAKKDIERLQRTVTDIRNVLKAVKRLLLLDGQNKPRLLTIAGMGKSTIAQTVA
jgi:hypothetical protein